MLDNKHKRFILNVYVFFAVIGMEPSALSVTKLYLSPVFHIKND